ncbi:MAG: hypothetical protein PHI97_29895 [Desulfobulbus sp.]|nr:hypothetical protein [Desulfobulbus sp.]
MPDTAKNKLEELVRLSKESLKDAEVVIHALGKSGILGITDEKFKEVNEVLLTLNSEERKEAISQFTKLVTKRFEILGFEAEELNNFRTKFEEIWGQHLDQGNLEINSKELYRKSIDEWEKTLANLKSNEVNFKKSDIERLRWFNISLSLPISIPALIGGAVVGNELFPVAGAIIGAALGALISSIAKGGDRD